MYGMYTVFSPIVLYVWGVQVDFKTRDVLEHKVDRELAKGLVKAGGDIEAGRQASGKA